MSTTAHAHQYPEPTDTRAAGAAVRAVRSLATTVSKSGTVRQMNFQHRF
ncbi:hypothetical protein [Streptomyces sp. NPDC059564]